MNIQLAFITGIPCLDLTPLGDIEMALAHLVLQDPDYALHYRKAADEGRHVILDNGAFEMQENGRGLDVSQVLRAADLINATELICSDVLYDGQATVDATRAFIEEADDLYPGRFQFMGAVQGSSADEFTDCYEQLSLMPRISCLGFSKLAIPRCFPFEYLASSRAQALAHCDGRHVLGTLGPPKRVHLLGGDASLPHELFMHVRNGRTRVRSQDSSFAYWYGLHDVRIERNTLHATKTVPGPIDFYRTPNNAQKSLMIAHSNQLLSCARPAV